MKAANELTARARVRLERARDVGYLNAMCPAGEAIVRIHSFWCWRLKTPVVWFERMSPRSKYGRVHLDLFTTPHVLTARGQAEMQAIAGSRVTRSDGRWENVPLKSLERVARAVFRAATRPGNYEMRPRAYSPEILEMVEVITQPEGWRRSA